MALQIASADMFPKALPETAKVRLPPGARPLLGKPFVKAPLF